MKSRTLLIASCLFALLTSSAMATENGGGAYPNGAEGFMTGLVPPPPGMYLIDYSLYYGASDFMDANGDEINAPFDLTVWGNIVRLINVTDKRIFGGQWVQHAFFPVLYLDVTTPGGSDHSFGIGDVIVDPFILAWHTKHLHWAVGLDTYIPVGKYYKGDLANLGRNYWTFEPVAAMTYLSDGGFDASLKVMYDINTRNDDTDYKSGDEFHFDWALGKRLGKCVLGVGGYYYKQVTGDDGTVMTPAGPVDAGDNKGQTIAIGPQIACQYKGISLVLKYQREFESENKFEGDKVWFKLITAL